MATLNIQKSTSIQSCPYAICRPPHSHVKMMMAQNSKRARISAKKKIPNHVGNMIWDLSLFNLQNLSHSLRGPYFWKLNAAFPNDCSWLVEVNGLIYQKKNWKEHAAFCVSHLWAPIPPTPKNVITAESTRPFRTHVDRFEDHCMLQMEKLKRQGW